MEHLYLMPLPILQEFYSFFLVGVGTRGSNSEPCGNQSLHMEN